MLIANAVSKSYRGIPAAREVSFRIESGEIVGLLGPNGAGKSTTVKMVTGMIEPDEGEVLFRGRPIAEDRLLFRASLGYVPEEAQLYLHLTGMEYLQLGGRLREMRERLILARGGRLLDLLGLSTAAHSPMALYSKGMKQRILLASALLHDPALLILDEPLSGLDVTTARLFRDLLLALTRSGKAILYISHVLEVVEQVCDRVVILAKGTVRAQGSPAELRKEFAAADLQAVFAAATGQPDTVALADRIVECLHEAA